MIDMIKRLLKGCDPSIAATNEKIEIFPQGLNYPEDCIEIEKQPASVLFTVAEVHRQEKLVKATNLKEDEACLYAAISYKRLFEIVADREKARKIRALIDSGNNKEALSCAASDFDHSIYSIGREDRSKISLIVTADRANIKYGGNYIVEHATLKQGYVAFYNYCVKLQYISAFCTEVQKDFGLAMNRRDAIRLYILGSL